MEDKDVIGDVLIAIGVIIVAPIILGGVIKTVGYTYAGIANGVNKIKFNKKIKKGLKDGSIVEIDGKYYEVEDVEEAK